MWKIFGRGFDSRRLHQLTVLLLLVLVSTTAAQSDQLLIFEGERKSQIPIVKVAGADYIPVTSFQSHFGLTSSPIGPQSLSLSSDSHNIILSAGRALVSVDEKLISLNHPVAVVKGVWYLPIDFIPKVLKITAAKRFLWLPNSRSLILGDLQPNELTLRYSTEKNYSRIVFQSTRAIGFTVLQDNGMLTITPQSDDFVSKIPDTQFRDAVIQRLITSSAGDRKVFQVQTGPDFASFKSMELNDPPRLVIDFFRKATAETPSPLKPVPPEKKAAPPSLLPSAVPEKRVIVLDPGHGGAETGAKGPEGAFEKDIVMGIARRLKAILESGTGARVILTRDSDRAVTLDDRTALANNNKADLFISIHANATIRGYAKGAETYFLSSQATDDESRNVAALENNAIGLNETSAVDQDLQLILWDMAQTEYLSESSQLAEMIQQELNGTLGISNRGIKQAPFRVLMGAMMPAVLIEVGFINNPAEERLMKSGEYQTKIASAIYRSIQKFQSARMEQSTKPEPSGR